MQPSLTVSRTIALVASALGLCTACFYTPAPVHYPPPPDLVTVSTDQLLFSAPIGQASESQRFSIANTSSMPISINPQSQWMLGNPKFPAFSLQTDCGPSLSAAGSCVVTVTFRPTVNTIKTDASLELKFHGDETHFVHLHGQVTQPSTASH